MSDLSRLMQPILDQLTRLRSRVDHMPVVRWGTVTSVSPLLVLLDGSLDADPLSPQSTVAGLAVGDRVACVEQHRRVIVIGRGGGIPMPDPIPNPLPVDRGGTGVSAANLTALKTALGIPYAQAAGFVTQAGTTPSGSGVNMTVTFPVGRFTEPPIVTANAASARLTVGIAISTVTTSGCTVRLDNWSGGTAPDGARGVQWSAKQMTSGSASG